MGQVELDADCTGCWRVAGTLEVTGAVGGVQGSPEVQALAGLNQWSLLLGEQINVSLRGRGEIGGFHAGICGAGVEGEREDWVILQVLANGEVDPVSLIWKSDRGTAVLNSGDLVGWTDTRVVEDTWGGHGSGSENDAAARI